jgi:hypothetical protein
MTTWVLIWIVAGTSYPQTASVATGSAVFHSKQSCEQGIKAVQTNNRSYQAYCVEDTIPQIDAKSGAK